MVEKTDKKIINEGKVIPMGTGKTANINIKQYSNILYEFDKVEDLDRDEVISDLIFWYDVINDFDKQRNVKVNKAEAVVSDDIIPITECRKCGSENIKPVNGTNAKTGKIWYAYECQECTEEFNGKQYKTKTFTDFKKDRVLEKVMEEDIPEEDVPF
jgi:hypothetical protein